MLKKSFMKSKKISQLPWLWLSALVIVFDQFTKTYISYWLDTASVMHVFPFLNFILTYNSGAAFSFLGWAGGWQRWLFVAISLGVSFYLVRLLYRGGLSKSSSCVAIALIIGGAIGNLYDRLTLGYVVDFIDFFVGHWHFATFNVADAAVSIGAVMWILVNYNKKSDENNEGNK